MTAPIRVFPGDLFRSPEEFVRLLAGVGLVVFDFDGVFTDNTVYVDETGRETVRCHRGDGLGISMLRQTNLPMVILSTETNPVVAARAAKLRLECFQGRDDKLSTLDRLLAERGLDPVRVAYLGNDINDLECLKVVGVPASVADGHADLLPHVCYRTQARGGMGAVREFCDLLRVARQDANSGVARPDVTPAGAVPVPLM